MPAEVLTKAFDPFFTTKTVGKGTGLGLSQVFGLVSQSGGQVVIDSELAKGATICICLPPFEGPDAPKKISASVTAKPAKAGEKVRVVEDEERVRVMVVGALQELGYSVITASSGSVALRLITHRRSCRT